MKLFYIRSRHYTGDDIKQMIERRKEQYGWEFLFIGANIDAVGTAAQYGIGSDRAVNYHADGEGTQVLYESVSDAVCGMRTNRKLGAKRSSAIDEDYRRRSKKST